MNGARSSPRSRCVTQHPSHSGTPPHSDRGCSSGCFVRRAPRHLARGSTRIIKRPESTPVRVATLRFTRAIPSSTAAAAGQRFLTVIITHFVDVWSHRVDCIFMPAIPGAVARHVDRTLGMERTEITCAACGGHLGHVFKGERFKTPSRHPPLIVSRHWLARIH